MIPMIFIFLSCRDKAHDNKEFSREIQNLVVNDESRPIKSNPEWRRQGALFNVKLHVPCTLHASNFTYKRLRHKWIHKNLK